MSKLVKNKKYQVHTYETDANGKLAITALFNYLQDIASQHAEELHFGKHDLEKKKLFWVLSRIYCEMDRMPLWKEEITVTTWPRGIDKLFALRDYEISDSNGVRIGGATSSWIMLNIETRRPVRPDYLMELIEGAELRSSTGRNSEKLPVIENNKYRSQTVIVKYSDLDVNMHVNNVRYLQWAIDSYPLDFRLKNILKSAEVNFLSESLPGDEVYVKVMESGENQFDHTVMRNNDGKELCRLRINWTG